MPETVRLYETLSRQILELEPIEPGKVRLYTCGPTVYNYAHIGNLRTYIFADTLRRTLEHAGYDVNHVMNVTDVGHLESDADAGEDKMAKASAREHRSPWEIARFYEEEFFKDCAALNIIPPKLKCRATEHVEQMIAFVQELEKSGHAYVVDGNVYFDIAKYPAYPELGRLRLDQQADGARVEADHRKRNPQDFVLWFSQSKFPNQIMKWESPWGVGFPGWHIECSVMASQYLGDRLDIHTGGIDHIPVHHTNERAQSEARFGHQWVNMWMHAEFLVMEEAKMSKSTGTFLTLRSLTDEGFDPIHYRYFCIGARYRTQLKFSWEALKGARTSLENLRNRVASWKLFPKGASGDLKVEEYRRRFWDAMNDDLQTPEALAILWEAAKDTSLSSRAKLELMVDFDLGLGLGIERFERPAVAPEMAELIREREGARARKDWAAADAMRNQLAGAGIQIKDTPTGTDWYVTFEE